MWFSFSLKLHFIYSWKCSLQIETELVKCHIQLLAWSVAVVMRQYYKCTVFLGLIKKATSPFYTYCAFIVLQFPDHLLSEISDSSVCGCVSCCVWVTWPAWTVWSACTACAAWNAAACQSCMDYRRHLANCTIRTIRLAFWVNFLRLCLHCHIQQYKLAQCIQKAHHLCDNNMKV